MIYGRSPNTKNDTSARFWEVFGHLILKICSHYVQTRDMHVNPSENIGKWKKIVWEKSVLSGEKFAKKCREKTVWEKCGVGKVGFRCGKNLGWEK